MEFFYILSLQINIVCFIVEYSGGNDEKCFSGLPHHILRLAMTERLLFLPLLCHFTFFYVVPAQAGIHGFTIMKKVIKPPFYLHIYIIFWMLAYMGMMKEWHKKTKRNTRTTKKAREYIKKIKNNNVKA